MGKRDRKAYSAEYYIRNKERIRARQAEYRAQHREEAKAYQIEYCPKNKDRKKAYDTEYRRNHPEKVNLAHARRRARLGNTEVTLTEEQWQIIKDMFKQKCVYCGKGRGGSLKTTLYH